jgi:alanyl-tRNA synthetase
VRQAGSYVGPDKLRFDFTHGGGLSEQELRDVEDQVGAWIAQADPVHPVTTTLDEAKRLGAMALFGEKYGDVVRMVEIGEGEYSRELCGGTHVANTSEIGVFRVTAETSSAANVRRIEALTGPAAAQLLREHDRELAQVAATLRTQPGRAAEVVAEHEAERKRLQKARRAEEGAGVDLNAVESNVEQFAGVPVVVTQALVGDAKDLPATADRVKSKLGGDGVVVLGAEVGGRAALLVSVAPSVVVRGVKAGAIVKLAAEVVGGGGGGRDTMAQAGGRDPSKLSEALATARKAIEDALGD